MRRKIVLYAIFLGAGLLAAFVAFAQFSPEPDVGGVEMIWDSGGRTGLAPDEIAETNVDARIDALRKGDAVVRVTGTDGRPARRVGVRARQVKHAFQFGFGLPSYNDLQSHYTAAQIERIFEIYSRLFNAATPQNAFKFGSIHPSQDAFDFSESDWAAAWCRERGMRMKIHCLVWEDGDQGQPDWLMRYSGRELEAKILEHANVVFGRYKNERLRNGEYLVYAIDVLNEPVHTRVKVFSVEPGFHARILDGAALAAARQGRPIAMTVNEYDVVSDGSRSYNHRAELLALLSGAEKAAVTVGLQCHSAPLRYDFDILNAAFRKLADAGTGGVHITEFMYPSGGTALISREYLDAMAKAHEAEKELPRRPVWTEEEQAAACVEMYRICFAEPTVSAISYWDVLDVPSWRPANKCGLVRADLSLKPSYEALDSLINARWRTSVSGRTGEDGEMRFRGFYGEYEIEVSGRKYSFGSGRQTD